VGTGEVRGEEKKIKKVKTIGRLYAKGRKQKAEIRSVTVPTSEAQ
jgi:hypothetical protein